MAEGSKEFGLIKDSDHILVGVSGGKDSLTLLDLLGRQQRMHVPSIHVEAVHIRMAEVEYASDTSYLTAFAQKAGVPLHIIETKFPTVASDIASKTKRAKPPCFLCSWARRKAMFNLAQKLGCNKIALGHHQDDIIRTALMNLTFQGQFMTMPAMLQMRKMPLTIIRPLCTVPESIISQWADEQGYQLQAKHCPHEHTTNRTNIQNVLSAMEALSPDARNSIWNALRSAGKLIEDSF